MKRPSVTARRARTGLAGAASCALLALGLAAPADAATSRAPSVTIAKVKASAPIPAYCQMPAMTLHGGKTPTKYAPKGGSLNFAGWSPPRAVDLDHNGAKELVVTYDCSAGGVSWPQLILVYSGRGPKLLGYVDLSRIGKQEHATVTSWSVTGSTLRTLWYSYEGAGFDIRYHVSTLSVVKGKVRFTTTSNRSTASVVQSVGNAFTRAAVRGDRATMKRLATPKALASLDAYGTHWVEAGSCILADSRAAAPSCEVTLARSSSGPALIFKLGFTVSRTGTARITAITSGGDAG